jgi:hypothetical protein
MSAYIKKTERSQINDLMIHRRTEIIKRRPEINEIETKKPCKELMKQKVLYLKK